MKTILVVEDEVDSAEALRILLDLHGYRVLVASNGREGFEAAIANQPDLVLTDVMMPIMDGRELIERMRVHPATRGIPIVAMSAAAELDGLRVLRKPFDVDALLVAVRRALDE